MIGSFLETTAPPNYNRELMHPDRIAELLRPFLQEGGNPLAVREDIYKDISMYIDILLHWNARINLTAIRDPEEIMTRHFGESLFAARHLFARVSSVPPVTSVVRGFDSASDQLMGNTRVADFGSGAGFPGLPIKLLLPEIAVTLIESNHKKATFLREVVRELTLTGVDIYNGRAETISPASFNLVTMRAVERLTLALPTAASLLASKGRLALLISSRQIPEVRATLPQVNWDAPIPIPKSEESVLLVGGKDSL